ncbi:unnamed protein product [Aphanomyces euteiches]
MPRRSCRHLFERRRHSQDVYYAKQPREYNYVNDGVHNIEIVRTALRYNSTVRLTDLHGGPYFPIKLVDQVIAFFQGGNATATTCSIRHAWKFHLMTLPTATCIAWIDQTQSRSGHDSDTLVFLLIPEAHGTFHRVSKMIMRIFLRLYIATCIVTQYLQPLLAMKRALRRYPIHPSSSAAVFVLFAGEPTSLILSNRFVCAVAVLDLVFSSEYLAQSCLRIACSDDSTLFVLGIMYLSHVVWFAYASLALMNQMLHRAKKSAWFRPVKATLLAILSYFLGGVCSYYQSLVPGVMTLYFVLFNIDAVSDASGTVVTIDTIYVWVFFAFCMCLLQLVVAAVLPWIHHGLSLTKSKLAVFSRHLSGSSSTNAIMAFRSVAPLATSVPRRGSQQQLVPKDFKHCFVRWVYLRGLDIRDVFEGATIYSIFEVDPSFQAQATLSQRGTDCYIMGYANTKNPQHPIEATRVSLVTQLTRHVVLDGTERAHRVKRMWIQSFESPRAVGQVDMTVSREGNVSVEFCPGKMQSVWCA